MIDTVILNSLVQGIISGVIANGLTIVAGHMISKSDDVSKHKENLQETLEKNSDLATVLREAIVFVAESKQFDDTRKVEKLKLFLTSPDVEAIIRQIYASRLISDDNDNHLESIRSEFLACISLYIDEPQQNLEKLSNHLFDNLLKGCEQAMAIAIDKGILSAHEAKSAARYCVIQDELMGIKRNLAFLSALHKPNVQEILNFEKKYLQQITNRHGYIIPPYFDSARKIPIDDIYVPPNFISLKEKGEEIKTLRMSDFLSGIYRAVLLGNPGGGKSTLSGKLCYDLSKRNSERLFARRQITPILIVLRDYGFEKKSHNYSILQFIEITANSKYQAQPPAGAFEYLLLNGHAVVIFDGLDELIDTSYRQEISSDIESFCNLYPSVPVLVTSREVGYEQAPLDNKRFEIFRLAPFDSVQVQDYVKKWFAADMDLSPEQQKQKIDAFLMESRIVPDLCSNPLMLALMCNIYRGENYIPKNRPDVYEKCSVMLFERWDKSRGICVSLPIDAHIKPAMMYLAHWIYTNEALQGGVTEKNLVVKTTEYLCPKRFEDRDEAEKAAREFIEFCRGRAWVFTDTGTTKDGDRLYQFTHRTFLEYFTSAYFVRTHPTPKTLIDLLLPRIAKKEWDVVAQLAFQLQNKNIENAGDELLSALCDQVCKSEDEEGWNILSFTVRCLEFIIPCPKVIRDITIISMEHSLVWGIRQSNKDQATKHQMGHSEPREIIGDLLNAARENRTTIESSIEDLLVKRINNGNELESILALEIGLHLSYSLFSKQGERIPQDDIQRFSERIEDRIFDLCEDKINILCPKYFQSCHDFFLRKKINLANIMMWHGIDVIFRERTYVMFPNTRTYSIAAILINALMRPSYYEGKKISRYFPYHLEYIREISHILFPSPLPWIRSGHIQSTFWIFHTFETLNRDEIQFKLMILDSDILFGVFAIFAVSLENAKQENKEIITRIKSDQSFFFDFSWILERFEQVDMDMVQTEMNNFGFKPEQKAFIWRWIRREFDLVEKSSEIKIQESPLKKEECEN